MLSPTSPTLGSGLQAIARVLSSFPDEASGWTSSSLEVAMEDITDRPLSGGVATRPIFKLTEKTDVTLLTSFAARMSADFLWVSAKIHQYEF